MIRKTQITFDAHSQTSGVLESRFVGEELLAEKEPLQVVNSFFCRLPFRLRLGVRTIFEIKGVIPARIVVINSVDIPNAKVEEELIGQPPRVRPGFASDVLITLNPIELKEDDKSTITRALGHPDYSKNIAGLPAMYVHSEDVLKSLNMLVVSYQVLSGQEIQWNRVRRVLRKDIVGGQTYSLHVFKRERDPSNFQRIEDSIAGATPTSSISFKIGGTMHDLPADNIAKLQHNLSHNTHYAFYSLALQAQDYIQQTDYLNALLYSVIAFENVHAELVEHVAETKTGIAESRKWAQNLLRDAGISTMVRLTPFLFMEPTNRPSDKTIEDTVHAIEIRNQLAHAKRDKNQNLKVDIYRSNDLLPLINAVFTYINTIARQLPD